MSALDPPLDRNANTQPSHPLSARSDNTDTVPGSPSHTASTSAQPIPEAGPSRLAMQSSTTQTTLAPTLPGNGIDGQKFDRFESPARAFPTSRSEGWDEAWERQQRERWKGKIEEDLRGWRGGNGTPRSGYTKEAVPTNSYYGQAITGTLGVHLPKEVIRIERDWSDGEVCQFESSFPMELEGRITPNQWKGFIHHINEKMALAYSVKGAVVDNLIAIATWWTSLLWRTSHFESSLRIVEQDIDRANQDLFNPAGLNILSPREFGLQFMEIEYY